ncbi:uncharacterized protein [Epargyreus clarus]|uniref:uncharacterized protein n=1 Tax=Epargyreus clarus TaxID=520877 RepID=UPI003C2FD4F5
MIVSGLSSSFNSSGASSQMLAYDDMDTTKIKNYVKDLLKSRIFLGRYLERRLIDQRIGYRDVVLVSAAEVDLKKDLLEAQHKLRSVCPDSYWIGISDADILGVSSSGTCICTEIDNQPFGPFWFQIKSIKFRDNEVIILLKCLRHISEAFLELEPILTGSMTKTKDSSAELVRNAMNYNETYSDVVNSLKSALSISNVKEFFSFIFVFIIAVFTGSSSFVNFLGNFILALVRELSILIKNSTPMFLGFLDFLSKIVGGFYILLAMFFKPSNPPPQNKRTLTYYDRTQHRPNQYDDRSFD